MSRKRKVHLHGPNGEDLWGEIEGERISFSSACGKRIAGTVHNGKVLMRGEGDYLGTLDAQGQLSVFGPGGYYYGEAKG